jgi:hypothetical protein
MQPMDLLETYAYAGVEALLTNVFGGSLFGGFLASHCDASADEVEAGFHGSRGRPSPV